MVALAQPTGAVTGHTHTVFGNMAAAGELAHLFGKDAAIITVIHKKNYYPRRAQLLPGIQGTMAEMTRATGLAVCPRPGSTLAIVEYDDPTVGPGLLTVVPRLANTFQHRRDVRGSFGVKFLHPVEPTSIWADDHERLSIRTGGDRYQIVWGTHYIEDPPESDEWIPSGDKYTHNGKPPIDLTEDEAARVFAYFDTLRPAKPTPAVKTINVRDHAHSLDDTQRAVDNLKRLAKPRCDAYGGQKGLNDAGWIDVGMMLTPLGGAGLQLWIEWSRGSAKFEDGACEAKWETFKKGGRGLRSLTALANLDDPAGKWTSGQNPKIAESAIAEPMPTPDAEPNEDLIYQVLPTGIMRAVEFLTKNVTLAKLIRARFALPDAERATGRTAREWAELAGTDKRQVNRTFDDTIRRKGKTVINPASAIAHCLFVQSGTLPDCILSKVDTVSQEVSHPLATYTFNDLATIREKLTELIDGKLHREIYKAFGGAPVVKEHALAADVPASEADSEVAKVNALDDKLGVTRNANLDRRFANECQRWRAILQDMTPVRQVDATAPVSNVTDAQIIKIIREKPRTSALDIARPLGIRPQRVHRVAHDHDLTADYSEPEIEIKRGRDLKQNFGGLPRKVNVYDSQGRLIGEPLDYGDCDIETLAAHVDAEIKAGHTVKLKIRKPNGWRLRTAADDVKRPRGTRPAKEPYVWRLMTSKLRARGQGQLLEDINPQSDDRYRQLWSILAGDVVVNPPLESKQEGPIVYTPQESGPDLPDIVPDLVVPGRDLPNIPSDIREFAELLGGVITAQEDASVTRPTFRGTGYIKPPTGKGAAAVAWRTQEREANMRLAAKAWQR